MVGHGERANFIEEVFLKRKFPDSPLIGVGVVVRNGESVLLIRRGNPPYVGEWSLPGGAQELGETVRNTAIREVREETGIEIADLTLLDVADLISTQHDGLVQHHYTLIDFGAFCAGGKLLAGSDAADAQWWPIDEAIELVTWTETKRMIRLAVDRMPDAP